MPRTTGLPLMRAIGRSIAEARNNRALSQVKLAARIGVSIATLANIEQGLHFPKLRTLLDLSRELATPLRDLLDEEFLTSSNSASRTRLELWGRTLLHDFNDEALALAVEQLSAFAKHEGISGAKRLRWLERVNAIHVYDRRMCCCTDGSPRPAWTLPNPERPGERQLWGKPCRQMAVARMTVFGR